ncbi:MAG: beta-ketoacyl synthase chain length factor [Burkholderiales bacterium]|nr:beta-ketoacyl synthase chain length factor [Burkholderiales bacterium]
MEIEFAISAWAGYAPSLTSPLEWAQWAAQPCLPQGDAQAAVSEMPAMLRRRLGPLGRLASQAAYTCQQSTTGTPVIFASRYGDAERSLKLLRDFAVGETVSPTDFALSVHNAVGALYSIARHDGSNFSSVAAGPATAAAALVEASALLEDGAREVLVVCYDAPLPGAYGAFADEPQAPYAWAWRVVRPSAGAAGFRLSCTRSEDPAVNDAAILPFGLDVMRFAVSSDRQLVRAAQGTLWTWRRND